MTLDMAQRDLAQRDLVQRPDLETLGAVIARSQIVVPPAWARPRADCLPQNFDETDLAILDWIGAEGRRASRSLLRI